MFLVFFFFRTSQNGIYYDQNILPSTWCSRIQQKDFNDSYKTNINRKEKKSQKGKLHG